MKEPAAYIVLACVAAASVVGASWIVAGNGLAISRYVMPRYEQVRRATFEESQTYVEGQRRDIANLRMEWLAAKTPEQKDDIRAVALDRIAGLPEAALSPDIIAFRNELQRSH